MIANGPIPPNLRVLHKCDNPPCVRPDHLFLGTQADNMRDMAAKGRRSQHGFKVRRGTELKHTKLDENKVRRIRQMYGTGQYALDDLAIMFKVSFSNVSMIVRRVTWKWVK